MDAVDTSQRVKRRGNPIGDALVAGLLFGALGLLSPFRLDTALSAAGAIGRTLAPILPRARARQAIASVFPEADAARLVGDMYAGFAQMFVEMARMEELCRPDARQRFSYEGLEHLEAARANGRGTLIATGHFANWEMLAAGLHHVGVPFSALTRPPDNPYLARFIARSRQFAGVDQIDRGTDGSRKLFARIKEGAAAITLVDLRVTEGIPVSLFGRPALTTYTPASLALAFDATLLPAAVRRTGTGRYTVVIHPPVAAPATGNRARDTIAMTEALNRFVETEIAAQPANWLWYLKRWAPVPELSRRAQRLLTEASGTGDRSL